jgi:hypothetical protein
VKKGGFRVSIIFPIAPHCLLTEEDDKVGDPWRPWEGRKIDIQKKIMTKKKSL